MTERDNVPHPTEFGDADNFQKHCWKTATNTPGHCSCPKAYEVYQ